METSPRSVALIGSAVVLLGAGAWKAWSCSFENYEIAPVLSGYPERHAVKTLAQLRAEMTPPAPAKEAADLGDSALFKSLANDAPADTLQKLDAALAQNRAKDYTSSRANFLWDLRDLVSSGARETVPQEEWKAYVLWRSDLVPQEKRGLPPPDPDGRDIPDWENAQEKKRLAEAHDAHSEAAHAALKPVDEQIAKSSPALLPHWLVVRGGIAFRKGMLGEAEKSFRTVTEIFPNHPRAETAAFMRLRIKVEEARRAVRALTWGTKGREAQNICQPAHDALNEFNKDHPGSRFAIEVKGWSGALATLEDDPWGALTSYLTQLDDRTHPENVETACREIERCLQEMVTEGSANLAMSNGTETAQDSTLVKEIARRPIAAMRIIYFLLDGAASVDFAKIHYAEMRIDDVVEDTQQMINRARHPKLLAALAKAVTAQRQLYQEEQWKPKFLAILAWAATEGGEHAQAAALCEKSPTLLAASDDLQLVRAVALSRAERFDAAAAAYKELAKTFPDSPLLTGLDDRLKEAQRRSGHGGLALWDPESQPTIVDEKKRVTYSREPYDYRKSEREQRQDVTVWFAPLPELQADQDALRARGLNPPHSGVMRARYLAREDFAKAKTLLDPAPPDPPKDGDNWRYDELVKFLPLPPQRWEELVKPIADLHEKLRHKTQRKEQAQLCWELALAWEKGRGQITLPATGTILCYRDSSEAALRQNALAMGYRDEAICAELDAVDELSKTVSYSLRTADLAKGTPLAAQALFKACESLRKTAEFSPYQQARAFETNASQLSRELYSRLQREHPKSPEAQLAMWFSFPSALETEWMPSNYFPPYVDPLIPAAMLDQQPPADESRRFYGWEPEIEQPNTAKVFEPLIDAARGDHLEAIKLVLQQVRHEWQPKYLSHNQSDLFNLLDDFDLMLQRSDVPPDLARRYILSRTSGSGFLIKADEQAPIQDFLDYQQAVTDSAPHPVDYKPDLDHWPHAETVWRKFLGDHPQSLKREAATFQLARAIARQHRLWVHLTNHQWPDSPFPGVYIGTAVTRLKDEKPTDGPRAIAALDEYAKAYPQGRYLADVHVMRGGEAIDAHDYDTAIRLLCATLDDAAHPELQLDASLNLAQCFEQLHHPEARAALIPALAKNPSAVKYFHRFAHSHTCGARLLVYEGFIDERAKELAGK